MARAKWKGGREPRDFGRVIGRAIDAYEEGATIILDETVEEGATLTQDYLEAAETRTGLRRQAEEGGFPGRHDSGNMVGSVSYEVRRIAKRVAMGVFGWWGSNFEDYFKAQDDPATAAAEGIPPARALPTAEVAMREKFRRRMQGLIKSGTVD